MDLPEHRVAQVGGILGACDEPTELQLDDILDLLGGELLHRFSYYSLLI